MISRLVFLTLWACLLGGCSKDAHDRWRGTWQFEPDEKLRALIEANPEVAKKAMPEPIVWTVTADTISVSGMPTKHPTSAYEVVKIEGDRLHLKMKEGETLVPVTVVFEGKNRVRLVDAEGHEKMRLSRMK